MNPQSPVSDGENRKLPKVGLRGKMLAIVNDLAHELNSEKFEGCTVRELILRLADTFGIVNAHDDLLAALIEAESCMTRHMDDNVPALVKVRAALAKATGGAA